MEIKGKIGGGITGLLLMGNPLGLVAGIIGGHYFFDKSIKFINIKECDLLTSLIGLSVGFIKSNPSHKRKDIALTYYVFNESFQLNKETQKNIKANLNYFYKSLKTSDITDLIDSYLAQVENSNKFILLDVLFIIYNIQKGFTISQWTYICKLAGWLNIEENELGHFKMKYSNQALQHYKTLSVSPLTGYQEIQKRYFHLAKKYHPDSQNTVSGKNMIKKINEAWNFIKKINKMETQLYKI